MDDDEIWKVTKTKGTGRGRGRGRGRGAAAVARAEDPDSVRRPVGRIPDSEKTPLLIPSSPLETNPSEDGPPNPTLVEAVRRLSLQTAAADSGDSNYVVTNFIRFTPPENWLLYVYDVSFTPEVDNRKRRRSFIDQLFGPRAASYTWLFDGFKMLYVTTRLSPTEKTLERNVKDWSGKIYRAKFMLTREMGPTDPQATQFYNLVFRHCLLDKLGYKQIRRYFYCQEDSVPVPQHKLSVMPGFDTAITYHQGGFMLSVDLSYKVLREQTAYDRMYAIYLKKDKGDYKRDMCREMLGKVVTTRYNNKSYTVDDIDFDRNPDSTFEKEGQKISFAEYYAQTYNRKISDVHQPLLVSRRRKRRPGMSENDEFIYLVPELCYMTNIEDTMRQDFRVMQDLATHTRPDPAKRAKMVLDLVKKLNRTRATRNEMEKWGMKVEPKLLNAPRLDLGRQTILIDGQPCDPGAKAEWSGHLRRTQVKGLPLLKTWFVVCPEAIMEAASIFIGNFKQDAPRMGFEVTKERIARLPDDRVITYISTLTQLVQEVKDLQMLVCIVPNDNKERYDAIKKLCYVDYPVPCQVITHGKLRGNTQKTQSVCTNIAYQIGVKLGGELWQVDLPTPARSTMVVGIDVFHDCADQAKKLSRVGFVATTNATWTRYYSATERQGQGEEVIPSIGKLFYAALKRWYAMNDHRLPGRILVFRDGVGDSQMAMVKEMEISQLKMAADIFIGDLVNSGETDVKMPKFTVIVCKKRISARFFMADKGGYLSNPTPGTTISTSVTRMYEDESWSNFYLVSQSVRQGTVGPTHYVVIENESTSEGKTIPVQMLQKITYKLTHLYFNWPGTIRVPAPVQYAHKLAFLAGQHLHRDLRYDHQLADLLFFL